MKFKSFKIVKILLMIKIKFLTRKFLYLETIISVFSTLSSEKEGSGAGSASGPALVTNGSGCGSGMPKNIRIRIRNTEENLF
jgi:hypothetical protein